MREIAFHVEGFTRRRDRDRLEKRSRARAGHIALTPIVAVVLVGAVLPVRQLDGPTHVARVHATDIRADRVVVLVDGSGSMAGTDQNVQSQLDQLRAAGISIANRVNIPGFAISFTDAYSLLGILLERVAANPSADTVYVISDFSQGDHDANEPVAYERLRTVLRERRLRLYWATVRDAPLPIYYAIARQSGGDVIGAQ